MNVVESLLDLLCVELGFCLPPQARDAIVAAPPRGVEAFARRVWEAEGLASPGRGDPLFGRLCEVVGGFPDTGSMRVAWPDGERIATVAVDPACRPLEVPHVLGRFEAGPGFARLAPALGTARERWAAGAAEAAFLASSRMDELGITATDELGRGYQVFNLVFDEGGLLFGVSPLWTPD